MAEDQDLLERGMSPAMERYRMAQAELAELQLAERKLDLADRNKAAGLESGGPPCAITKGRNIIEHQGTEIPVTFPREPGLYLARHGRDLEGPYNAILDVTGTPPYLESVLHSIGYPASESWAPTQKRLRVGPQLTWLGLPITVVVETPPAPPTPSPPDPDVDRARRSCSHGPL